jgi:DNA-directed RNA polymerase subunit beta'
MARSKFEDVVEGVSVSKSPTSRPASPTASWSTGVRARAARTCVRPSSSRTRRAILKLPRGGEARYLLSVDAILSVEPGSGVKAGDVLARIPLESAKTRDITGGLPRVAELFEARRPKDHAIIAEISGRVEFGRDYKNKRRIRVVPEDESSRRSST